MNQQKRAAMMWEIIKKHPSAKVAWYLITSYLYYVHDKSLLPDEDFDRMCHQLMAEYEDVEHPHKHLVTLEDLQAGTGYAIQSYPQITQSAAGMLALEDGLWRKPKRTRR